MVPGRGGSVLGSGGRYLVDVRAPKSALVAAAAYGLASCSGGGGGATALEQRAVCDAFDRLAASAAPVEGVDLSDPASFEEALDEAVSEYVAALQELRDLVPDTFEDDIDQLQAAASQYRFRDALDARVALEEFEQATCGETVPSTGEAQ